jgi:hypothetical protein
MEDWSFPTEEAGEKLVGRSCAIGLGALKVGFGGTNCSGAFVPSLSVMFSLTSLFTLGLGITGEVWINFSTRLIFVVGAGLCSLTACKCENLTAPKIVSTVRCVPIEAIHAQNVTLPLRQVETVLCFIEAARKTLLYFIYPPDAD